MFGARSLPCPKGRGTVGRRWRDSKTAFMLNLVENPPDFSLRSKPAPFKARGPKFGRFASQNSPINPNLYRQNLR